MRYVAARLRFNTFSASLFAIGIAIMVFVLMYFFVVLKVLIANNRVYLSDLTLYSNTSMIGVSETDAME